MATTTLTNGLEVPSVAGGGVSSSSAYSPRWGGLNIPLFDEAGYEEWVVSKITRGMMALHEVNNGLVLEQVRRQIMFVGLEMEAERLVFGAKKKKRKNKGVRWFVDVPYKHSEKTGEVFEGPISSQKTYEKEEDEEQLVFVNQASSE